MSAPETDKLTAEEQADELWTRIQTRMSSGLPFEKRRERATSYLAQAIRKAERAGKRAAFEEAAAFVETHDTFYIDGKAEVQEVRPRSDASASNLRLAAALRKRAEEEA